LLQTDANVLSAVAVGWCGLLLGVDLPDNTVIFGPFNAFGFGDELAASTLASSKALNAVAACAAPGEALTLVAPTVLEGQLLTQKRVFHLKFAAIDVTPFSDVISALTAVFRTEIQNTPQGALPLGGLRLARNGLEVRHPGAREVSYSAPLSIRFPQSPVQSPVLRGRAVAQHVRTRLGRLLPPSDLH
jgi:hypothetical protein